MQVSRSLSMVALVSAVLIGGCGGGSSSREMTVDDGKQAAVSEVTRLAKLTLGRGASLVALPGHDLTLTINGVETPIRPGTYGGDIVLTPTSEKIEHYQGMGTRRDYRFRAGVHVTDGKYEPARSVAAAVKSGSVSDAAAEGVAIRSVGDEFMGILVDGESRYRIVNPQISLTGNGVNDFDGFGAAIRIGGKSIVTIDGARISNQGAVRTALWAGGESNVVVNKADIEVRNGTLPKDYGWSWVKGGGGDSGFVMMEVPWMLGIVGNNRATLAVGKAKVQYNDSHIKAQTWGAMSTDAVQQVELRVNRSHVEVVESGYGAYADGNSLVVFSNSKVDVPDYGLILSGGSGVITDGTVINSRRNAVMGHGGSRGTLTVEKGSVLNAGKAVFQLKSASPTIIVDGAKLHSANGIILQVMANDDPNKRGPGGAPPPGMGAPGAPMAPPGAPPVSGGKYSTDDGDNEIDATFRNVELVGDFLNTMPETCGMNLVFENARVSGAISTAAAHHAVGPAGEALVIQESSKLHYLIGEQTQTPASTKYPGGARARFDAHSSWIVDKTSYLGSLTLADGASLRGPAGYVLSMTVNGKPTPIAQGTYSGAIVLTVVRAGSAAP